MNHFIEYICRSTLRSEDAIRCLNKRTAKLAKRVRITNAQMACVMLAGLCVTGVLVIQDLEIKALQKQVADLTKDENDVDATEEQNQQEGA